MSDPWPLSEEPCAICVAKLRSVNQAYKKIKTALGAQPQAQDHEPIIDLIRLAENGDNESAYKLACLLDEGLH